MKVLIISQSYPSSSDIYASAFIHSRSINYLAAGVDLDIVSFAAKNSYDYEGVHVHSEAALKKLLSDNEYDAVVCHAPNLRNHLRWLLLHIEKIDNLIFIFHGHEILDTSKYYPNPFSFNAGFLYLFKKLLVKAYDFLKRKVLGNFIKKHGGNKLKLIFVSQYLKKLFEEGIDIPREEFEKYSTVIYNPLGDFATEYQYDWTKKHHMSFVTIRPFDNSVYKIDTLVKFARKNPFQIFHLYGVGKYFRYNSCPVNMKIINRFVSRCEMSDVLNRYDAAIMLSVHDTQGVMMCEMAAFGIPLIVSDTPAAREMLSDVKNVIFIDNANPDWNLKDISKNFKKGGNAEIIKKLSAKNTSALELKFFKKG